MRHAEVFSQEKLPFGEPNRSSMVVLPIQPTPSAYLTHWAGSHDCNTRLREFGSDKPLDDPRLLLYRPNGKPASSFAGEVAKSTAYANIAAWQMMKGAFNINSTSVLAWKAMLASIHDAQALFSQIDKTTATSALTSLTPPATNETRISRFRLPASNSAADGGNAMDGYLTQADLLNVLGNAATARSDTFTIRGYGEARDASGQVTASATCEAVVQRLPDWYDPADAAETAPASLTSGSNKTMGRRFRLLAFRWLNTDEI